MQAAGPEVDQCVEEEEEAVVQLGGLQEVEEALAIEDVEAPEERHGEVALVLEEGAEEVVIQISQGLVVFAGEGHNMM